MNRLNYFKLNEHKDLSVLSARRVLAGIILLAAVLRLWGIWHGYPYSYYPDEAHFVKRALSFGSGDLNPHWFHKPAFYMYLLFFEYGLFYVIGKVIGLWQTVHDFALSYIKNPGPFYLIGRITTTAFSIGSIIVTYFCAKQLFNRKVGLLSVLLLALSFGHVMVAKDIKADTPCMFFSIVSAYFLIRYMRHKSIKHIILSAIFAGIGTATKYYTNVMLMPILFGLLITSDRILSKDIGKKLGIFLLCLLSFYLVYFVCSPFNFIDPLGREATFKRFKLLQDKTAAVLNLSKISPDEKNDSFQQKEQISLQTQLKGFKDYLFQFYKGMGSIIFFAIILGFMFMFFNLNRELIVFFSFPFIMATISIFLHPGYPTIRHQIALYPFLMLCGAVFFAKSLDLIFSDKKFAYVLLLILFIPFYRIIDYNIFISREDTRNSAKIWIESEIPENSKLLVDENGPPIEMSPQQVGRMRRNAEKANSKGQFTAHYDTYLKYREDAIRDSIRYDLQEIRFPWWRERESESGVHLLTGERDRDIGNPLKPVGVESYDFYLENGFEYAIVHSDAYDKFLQNNQVSRSFPSFTKFYRDLFDKGILIKEFNNQNGKIPGPVIKVFKFN